MAYATADDLRERFGAEEIRILAEYDDPSDDEPTDAEVAARAEGRIEAALRDATALIDGYLAGRYGDQVEPTPTLKKLCLDIARYELSDDRPTEAVEKRNDQAIRYLERIADNKADLGGDNESTGDDDRIYGSGDAISATQNTHRFSRDNLSPFIGR